MKQCLILALKSRLEMKICWRSFDQLEMSCPVTKVRLTASHNANMAAGCPLLLLAVGGGVGVVACTKNSKKWSLGPVGCSKSISDVL